MDPVLGSQEPPGSPGTYPPGHQWRASCWMMINPYPPRGTLRIPREDWGTLGNIREPLPLDPPLRNPII